MSRPHVYTIVALILAVSIGALVYVFKSPSPLHITSSSNKSSSGSKTANPNNQTQTSSFNKNQYSLSDPTSQWVVVNKTRPLSPVSYAPSSLVVPTIPLRLSGSQGEMHVSSVMAPALEQMVSDAKTQNILFDLQSGYRSYGLQVSVYGNEVSSHGQAIADQESARPGYSEHQTGLAADLGTVSGQCEVAQCFATTPEGIWLAANAYRYGFIIRYPSGKTNVTGYEYEPWHVRYVGVALATQMHQTGAQTLEEFFGLPAAPTYL